MDGAIIPTSVGVNPVMTISILAERCCRLLIEDAEWKIDYNSVKDFSMFFLSLRYNAYNSRSIIPALSHPKKVQNGKFNT